jgi:DNA-binding transcriptional ArsR family regulator
MTKQPPMTDRVLEQLAAIGHGTVDDIMHNLQGLQRTQVTRALSRLQQAGLLRCDGYRRGRDTGVRGGSLPGIYYILGEYTPKPKAGQAMRPKPLSFIFDAAKEREVIAWPPVFEGSREYQLLGGWSLESDVCEEATA